ncbi:hypothetical protein [Duganella phyllosphaerae]|uniref:hypothetical protein n=1 Tax=Duganella phyllosphaerae TaxID=762836 RepID=UPI001E2875E3|nr:hypothetical protein [Duganella phyllosphaerae]
MVEPPFLRRVRVIYRARDAVAGVDAHQVLRDQDAGRDDAGIGHVHIVAGLRAVLVQHIGVPWQHVVAIDAGPDELLVALGQLAELFAVAVGRKHAGRKAHVAPALGTVHGGEQQPVVVHPARLADVGIAKLRHHGRFHGGQVHHRQAVAPALGAGKSCQVTAIGREHGAVEGRVAEEAGNRRRCSGCRLRRSQQQQRSQRNAQPHCGAPAAFAVVVAAAAPA